MKEYYIEANVYDHSGVEDIRVTEVTSLKEFFIFTKDEIDMAKRLHRIATESPESGNALMDLLGLDCYQRVMKVAKYKEKGSK